MNVRETKEPDWKDLNKIRLAALLDSPTAFGVSYQTAINDSDNNGKNVPHLKHYQISGWHLMSLLNAYV